MSRAVVQLLGPSTGGIRAHVGELARRLRAHGWRVVVAGPGGVMAGVGEQDATVAVPDGWRPDAVVHARAQLSSLLRDQADVAVLHAHGWKAALVALTIRRRPPLVLTVHNLVAGTHAGVRSRVLRRVEAAIARRVDHVIVISDEIAARLDGLVAAERRTFALPVSPARLPSSPPEDVRREHGIAADAPLVVVVARLHPQKDLPTFLGAMAIVREHVPGVRALVVGDGPDRAALEQAAATYGVERTVTFTGFRGNPADEMAAADVVALSSRWEGSPLVVAEYLALGKPLVTTAVGTVTRHLVDRESARIVPVGDQAAFAAAVTDLLADPDEARRIGERGRAVAVAVFDPDRLVEGVERVYAAVQR